LVFLGVYRSRLGASSFQVGLLTSIPALANVIFTFPSNALSRGRTISRMVPRAALITRLLYGLLIPLPVLLMQVKQVQIWVILVVVLIVNIPGTMAAVLGNAFFAESVPDRYRGHVVSMRNALLAAVSVLASFSSGLILKVLPFHWGYMVVFAMGVVGLLLSVVQLFQVKPVQEQTTQPFSRAGGVVAVFKETLRFDVLRSPFAGMLVVMFFFHLAVFLPGPMFPLYQVNQLKISDQTISIANSIYWVVHFLTSTQASRLCSRYGYKKILGVGTLAFSAATLIFAYGYNFWVYLSHTILSGIGWSLVGASLINYLLDKIPSDDRPAYLAWFNLIVNVAVLICGLIAAPITGWMGLVGAMLFAIVLRFLAGAAILRWG
jgi:MFS family permease